MKQSSFFHPIVSKDSVTVFVFLNSRVPFISACSEHFTQKSDSR